MTRQRSRFQPSALAGRIGLDQLTAIFEAAHEANVGFVMDQRDHAGTFQISLSASGAALYLVDPDQFWIQHFRISPERYFIWKQHCDRANETDQVQCLAPTKAGRQCRNLLNVQWNARQYDPAVDDYCSLHQEQYSDLRAR
jgi:hypothetical protein